MPLIALENIAARVVYQVDIASVLSAVSSLIAAACSGFAVVHAAKAKRASYKSLEEVREAKVEIKETKADVHKVELATNSIVSALLKTTREDALKEGEEKGREDQKDKQEDKESKE